jgi:RND family efflux transporter MFP subunit
VSFRAKRITLIAAILIVAIAAAAGLSQLKPPPQVAPVGNVQLLIDVQTLESGSYSFEIESQGTVRPLTETILSAEVSGSIVRVSPKFVAGGVFAAGEELMRIDPTNYVGAVDQAVALVKQRQIEFDGAKTLRTQGYRAEAEFAAAEASLATAKANLIRARRDLERTRIRLPYEGMVRSRSANLGQFVNPGKELGVVFATDIAEVRLPLTDQDLAFVDLPDASEITDSGVSANGPAVTLTAVQRGRTASWTATIVRSEGVVDERARVTYAVARITDPYRLHRQSAGEVPLPMGTFVSARIAGATIDGAVRLPRSSLRSRNEVIFVDKENRLRIRPVEVIRTDSEYAYIAADSLVGERISLTAIESPIDGAKVRTTDDPPEPAGDEQELATAGNGGD